MSDEDDFMISADEEDFDFEYDDDDGEQNPVGDDMETDDDHSVEFDAENKYYNAKAYKDEDPQESLLQFEQLYLTECEGDWAFKAIKQAVKLSFALGDTSQLAEKLGLLLNKSQSVSKSYAEKSLNNLIERFTLSNNAQLIELALKAMSKELQTVNERLWIKTNLKLANIYVADASTNETHYHEATSLLGTLETALASSTTSSSLYLEVLALELELCLAANDMDRLRLVYAKTLQTSTAVPHPKIMGVIKSCGGRLYVDDLRWEEAAESFFESFQNFDEAGMIERLTSLQYYVLTCMLANTGINPFESQETKPYKDHPMMAPLVQLVSAFEIHDLDAFNHCVKKNESVLHKDHLMSQLLNLIVKSLLGHGILEIVKSYRSISLEYLCAQLAVDLAILVESIVHLILDGTLAHARLDVNKGYLYVNHVDSKRPFVKHEPEDTFTMPKRYIASHQEGKLRNGSSKTQVQDRTAILSTWLDATSSLHGAVAHN